MTLQERENELRNELAKIQKLKRFISPRNHEVVADIDRSDEFDLTLNFYAKRIRLSTIKKLVEHYEDYMRKDTKLGELL